MSIHRRKGTAGFTLVELLVVVVLTGIVSVGLYQMLFAGRRSHDINKHQVEMQQNARVAINSLADDFRHVSYGKDPTQPSIRYAGADSLVFVADIRPEIPGAEFISYYLDPMGDIDTPNPNDTVLMKAVADSGGAVLYTIPQSYGIAYGGMTLSYANGTGVPLPTPVPQPEQIGEMAIEVIATESQSYKQQPYSTMALTATIYPRNLPLSPARSRPSRPACNDVSYPVCSAVTLTWATPTTNTDGTELPLADISHFSIYFGTDPEDLSLSARTARTINEWTVGDVGCDNYYIAVTCVSRSGVESYQCRRPVNVTAGLDPKSPTTLIAIDSLGVGLNWTAVTEFIDDDPIDVPVIYHVYRDTSAGFTADETTEIGTVSSLTSYHDPIGSGCAIYYYKVRAAACCSTGDPSPEASIERPPPPGCPTNLIGFSGEVAGTLILSWDHPTQRDDLTDLPIGEIAETWVYYDTLPGSDVQFTVVSGTESATTISGLQACMTYYVHARTVDLCGHPSGSECYGNEIPVPLAEPCNPDVPTAPGWLALDVIDTQFDLRWPTNLIDCDLYGYRIYYGTESGNYNGMGADQGDSPIQVTVDQVTLGGQCELSMTGLEPCTTYNVAVSAIDRCEPPHESGVSPEIFGETSCVPCQIESSCPSWVATMSAGFQDLRLEIMTPASSDQTLAKLLPSWQGGAQLLQVYAGRPLGLVWSEDGTAGEDGNVGPQPAGAVIDLDDTIVPAWTSYQDGQPLALLFTEDVRDLGFDIQFRDAQGGSCITDGMNRGAALFDNFDDGDMNGWTIRSGSWDVDGGELFQSDLTGARILISEQEFGDLTYEGKICLIGGTTTYIIFRYTDDQNFYMMGLKSNVDVVRLARYYGGGFTQTAVSYTPVDANRWYNMKVVVEGKTVRAYFDCELVMEHTDNLMSDSGKIGFRTYYSTTRWDDIRCQNVAQLP